MWLFSIWNGAEMRRAENPLTDLVLVCAYVVHVQQKQLLVTCFIYNLIND